MGFSIKELRYKERYLLYMAEQQYSGAWFSFIIRGKHREYIPVILKNVEPTPIYKLVNSKKGKVIDRITLDFDINEYLKRRMKEGEISSFKLKKKESRIRMYIDIFLKPKVPYMNTFFTLKNMSEFKMTNLSMYFIFDFDINGLDGFNNDYCGYDFENDIIYQFDHTGLHAGFSTLSKPTFHEAIPSREFEISRNKLNLSNRLHDKPDDLLSALQIEFKTLEPNYSFQTVLVNSGGFGKKELIQNIIEGKRNAIKFLGQVNRSVKSKQRNEQEEAFVKLNLKESQGCK
ncbi:MAG: hypothetical protein ACTSU4_03620 [Promethearchaeota archaeon]